MTTKAGRGKSGGPKIWEIHNSIYEYEVNKRLCMYGRTQKEFMR